MLTEDDVLKIVDFGVSEMFEKSKDVRTSKSAGSPAFLPPELCVAKHGDVSGRAADIWSMGVSLYCLRYGRIPFERSGVLDMYEAIRTESPQFPPDENPEFVDLMGRLMEKDPEKRIKMPELRASPPPPLISTVRTNIPDRLAGAFLGDKRWEGPFAQRRRELRRPRRPSEPARAKPCLYQADDPPHLCRKCYVALALA